MAEKPDSIRHSSFQDLTGRQFGRLTVVEYAKSEKLKTWWRCQCACGAVVVTYRQALVQGRQKSCGCLRTDQAKKPRKHKSAVAIRSRKNSAEYTTYRNMINRCRNPNEKSYKHYGAKGIAVCDRWLNGENGMTGFECFAADMGRKKFGQSIDRRKNEEGYHPSNCRWATTKQQNNNYSRNRNLAAFGKTQNATQWGAEFNIDSETILARIKRGWNVERSISEPVHASGRWKRRSL